MHICVFSLQHNLLGKRQLASVRVVCQACGFDHLLHVLIEDEWESVACDPLSSLVPLDLLLSFVLDDKCCLITLWADGHNMLPECAGVVVGAGVIGGHFSLLFTQAMLVRHGAVIDRRF